MEKQSSGPSFNQLTSHQESVQSGSLDFRQATYSEESICQVLGSARNVKEIYFSDGQMTKKIRRGLLADNLSTCEGLYLGNNISNSNTLLRFIKHFKCLRTIKYSLGSLDLSHHRLDERSVTLLIEGGSDSLKSLHIGNCVGEFGDQMALSGELNHLESIDIKTWARLSYSFLNSLLCHSQNLTKLHLMASPVGDSHVNMVENNHLAKLFELHVSVINFPAYYLGRLLSGASSLREMTISYFVENKTNQFLGNNFSQLSELTIVGNAPANDINVLLSSSSAIKHLILKDVGTPDIFSGLSNNLSLGSLESLTVIRAKFPEDQWCLFFKIVKNLKKIFICKTTVFPENVSQFIENQEIQVITSSDHKESYLSRSQFPLTPKKGLESTSSSTFSSPNSLIQGDNSDKQASELLVLFDQLSLDEVDKQSKDPHLHTSQNKDIEMQQSNVSQALLTNEPKSPSVQASNLPLGSEELLKKAQTDSERYYLILTMSNDGNLNKVLTNLVRKKRKLPHNDRRRMVNFFRFSDASSYYPLTPVLAMLRLIQNKYAELDDGRHQVTFHNFMNKLSQCQSLQCQEVHSAIWQLVRSGNIGSRLGRGRLRGALKEVCQSIDAGRPLDVDEVLSRLCSKRNVYGFLNR